jgi:hypothetical protein
LILSGILPEQQFGGFSGHVHALSKISAFVLVGDSLLGIICGYCFMEFPFSLYQ